MNRKPARIEWYIGDGDKPWMDIDTSEYMMESIVRIFTKMCGTGSTYKQSIEINFSFNINDQSLTLMGFELTNITVIIDFFSLKEERNQKIEKILKED